MSRGRACTQGKGLSASNSAPCMIISEVIKELEIERKKIHGNEASPNIVFFWSMDDFSSSTVSSSSVGFHFENVQPLTVYFPACVRSYHAIQACSRMFPSSSCCYHCRLDPSQPQQRFLVSSVVFFMLSTAASHSNNRLLLYMILYRHCEQSNRQAAVSSSELTGRLGGYDHTQLTPPATLSSPSTVSSGSRFLPDLLISPLISASGKSKTPSHLAPASWLAFRQIK